MADQQHKLDRRGLLKRSAGLAAGVIAAPAAAETFTAAPAAASPAGVFATRPAPYIVPNSARYDLWSGKAFVDDYLTNSTDNLSSDTNAAVRILTGMEELWQTGSEWDNGTVLDPGTLRDNMRYVAEITAERTVPEAKQSYIFDRQHQSHSALGGLGPLESLFKSGAKAVTAITGAPDGVPDGKISDSVPPDAPPGSERGAGSTDSDLGRVVELVNTVRGPHASSNPSKYTYQYPRPWRMNEDSEVVETDGLPFLGIPVYDTDVIAAPQLLRQRSDNPDEDGGYPSGHANAAFLASFALAHAVPERFQELLVRAGEVAHSRIVSGMHSPVDTIGGRILATALAAAALYDPTHAELKADARAQALAYFTDKTGTTVDTLYSYAHREGPDTDRYADHAANRELYEQRLTYFLERRGDDTEMTVPKGAEVLLETRLPYLDAEQRREVLRTTALRGGYALLDGPEKWGRLNLFAAADGYGRFDGDVRVSMDASKGGFNTSDMWRNDIGGKGKLMKVGSGSLALAGDNTFSGEVYVESGTLVAASSTALGKGDVSVKGGTLVVDAEQVEVRGAYTQAGAALRLTVVSGAEAPLKVSGRVGLESGSVLELRLDPQRPPAAGESVPVIAAKGVSGEFGSVVVDLDGYTATAEHSSEGVSVRIDA
ncbi:phosphatase PAP2 family protein [Glycomyces sp. L485]|uniref:phosphatase PAP2 family protein n=1 Tax=Glycomyces sp. L485 TaxID=2909235 RepID=UPI001F4A5849|nr:phosphatase PAP2 family protein [Glycomyces sp. L485]MCH7232806.1 phosphatase PAP2 family protein [Glycomyces sp. L485]